MRPDEVRLIRQVAFCTPREVLRAVANAEFDQVPVRSFFNLADLRGRLRAGTAEETQAVPRPHSLGRRTIPLASRRR